MNNLYKEIQFLLCVIEILGVFILLSIFLKKRKCIKRNAYICSNFLGFPERDLQDRNSDSSAGNGILYDLHGIDKNGVWIWCGSNRYPAGWWTDRVHFMEYCRWICFCIECIYSSELWCREAGSSKKRVSGISVDCWNLGLSDHVGLCIPAGTNLRCVLP